jgi:chromosome segregation ATPase
MSKYGSALAILRKIRDDEKNWRIGMAQLDELLRQAEEAEATLAQATRQQADLQASIARLTDEKASLQQSVTQLEQKRATVKETLREEERPKLARLAELDGQIAAQELTLAALRADLDRLREKHLA